MESKPMTKERLESYRSNMNEIVELEYKLLHPDEDITLFGNDTIMDYRSGFPIPQSVFGFDTKKFDRFKKRTYKRLEYLYQECGEIEDFIYSIEKSDTRRIFQLYFMEGKEKVTQEKVAEKLNMHRSSISKKIDEYLQVSHNSHYSHV